MTANRTTPAFQAQFDEIARLETALRSGELTGPAAIDALQRLYELMDWQTEATPEADIDYVFA